MKLHMIKFFLIYINFTPKIIMSDFAKAIHLFIKNNKYFKDKTIHIKCFFYCIKMIRQDLVKTGICNKKLNKLAIEIIRNLQMLCFIKKQILINLKI